MWPGRGSLVQVATVAPVVRLSSQQKISKYSLLQAIIWYVAWSRISGPSSDCGSSGQAIVTTEDQKVFITTSYHLVCGLVEDLWPK